MKTAVLYICTGKYSKFYAGFYESAEKWLLKDISEIEYFVFTDDINLTRGRNVHLIETPCAGFPDDSLFRFEMFLRVKESLKDFDYIYFFNSNAAFCRPVGSEILPDETGLVAAEWPKRTKRLPALFPYERNRRSTAYIAPFQPPYAYYMGGINGGAASAYLNMVETCAMNIRADYARGIIARVHDESHINKYLRTHACKTLSSEYCWPEEWTAQFSPRIIFRDKGKIDPYFNKGRDRSLWGKMKKGTGILYRAIRWYV